MYASHKMVAIDSGGNDLREDMDLVGYCHQETFISSDNNDNTMLPHFETSLSEIVAHARLDCCSSSGNEHQELQPMINFLLSLHESVNLDCNIVSYFGPRCEQVDKLVVKLSRPSIIQQ